MPENVLCHTTDRLFYVQVQAHRIRPLLEHLRCQDIRELVLQPQDTRELARTYQPGNGRHLFEHLHHPADPLSDGVVQLTG